MLRAAPIVRLAHGVVLGLAASACRPKSRPSEPFVDRSNGALPSVKAARVEPRAIAIDARLDEPAWQRAASTGPFVQPSSGRPAPESKVNAVARVAWDPERLYLGIVIHDPKPTTPFSRDELDPHVWAKASGVELMLQPGDPGDNREYYEVQVDVGGALWDTRFDDYNQPISGPESARRFGHQEWQSGLERATRLDPENATWIVELALPWRSLESTRARIPPTAGDVWRMNLYSFRDGQRDSLAWSPVLGQGNFHRASRFGRLELGE